MQRRRFLAGGTALLSVAVAGCGHPSAVLDMEEATTADIAGAASTTVDPESEADTIVTSALENGSTTRTGDRLFGKPRIVRIDDTFYDVSETELGRTEVKIYEVHVELHPDNSTPDIGEIEYADLPDVDRERLGDGFSKGELSDRPGYDIGVEYGTAEEVGNGSAFVPDRQYDIVVHDGDRYRVAVGVASETVSEYRYEVTEFASDVEAFADRIRAQYLVTLDDLSDDERAVVEEAIDGTYYENDDAFRSVTDRIESHEPIYLDEHEKRWLVEYDGVEYLTYIQ